MSMQRRSRSPWWPTIAASAIVFVVLFVLTAVLVVMFGFGNLLQ